MAKQVAPLRQYHFAYASGHVYVWNVMLGRTVDWGARGFGVDREEQPSARQEESMSETNEHTPGVREHSILAPITIPADNSQNTRKENE